MSRTLETIEITPVDHPIDAVVRLPGSKSYTNRALLIAGLADGTSVVDGALFSDDTRYMIGALRELGIPVEDAEDAERVVVHGQGGSIPAASADLYVGNAGTAARFLTAALALGKGRYRLDGVKRMRERPIGPLLEALEQLGVSAQSEFGNGCPPIVVEGKGLPGGKTAIAGDVSSQFISALMLVGPCIPRGLEIEIRGELVSKPYVDLTISIMAAFGAFATNDAYRVLRIPGGQGYRARPYLVEPDASSASYFFAAAAVTGGRIRVEGLGKNSAQGDLKLVDVLETMGCTVERGEDYVELRGPGQLRGIDVDMGNMSDVAQTLAAIAPFAADPVRIRGVEHNRWKETDRVAAVTNELRRLGVDVDEHRDGWEIRPSAPGSATVETYDDHRMAMSFAVTGLRSRGIQISNPRCVEKTFPDFFERFRGLT